MRTIKDSLKNSEEAIKYIQEHFYYVDGKLHSKKKANIGWIRNNNGYKYMCVTVCGRTIKRSHVVWYINKGFWPEYDVIHKDGDTINDDIDNLREATRNENFANRVGSKQYKGFTIFQNKDKTRTKSWRARNYKYRVDLGYFFTKEDAEKGVDDYNAKGGKWWSF